MAPFLQKRSLLFCFKTALLLLLGFAGGEVRAQCTNTTQYPSGAVSLATTNGSGAIQTITTVQYAGEYFQVTTVQSGRQYRFASSTATDYITVRSGTYNGTVLGQGTTPVTVTTAGTADLFVHINTSSACGSQSISRTTTAQCITCAAFDPCASIPTISCGTPVTATPSGTGVWSVTTCGFSTPGQERIYSFTPTTTGTHQLQVTSATGGYIDYFFKAASGGCSSTGWTCILDISSAATVSMGTLTAGTQYYILLDPEGTGSYSHTFQINCPSSGPANNDCAGATTLTSGTSCVTTAGTTVNATQSIAAITCSSFTGTADDDVWYKFTAVAASHTVTVAGGGTFDAVVDVRSGACNGTNIGCADATFGGGTETVTVSGLTVGATYYVRVYSYGSLSSNQGTFTICVTHSLPDPCSSITTLACATPATATLSGTGVWNFAGTSPTNSCGFTTSGQEKIYSFTPTITGLHSIQVTSSTGSYIDYFYKAASGGCGNTGWTCIDDISIASTVAIGTLTAGVQYYILLDAESTSSVTQTFQIICPAPDPCLSVTTLACATLTTATLSGTGVWNMAGTFPSNSCGFTTSGQEKIYSFTPTVTGVHSLEVTSSTGSYIDYFYKAASGGCSNTGWTCIDDISIASTVTIGTLTAGVQYYILLDQEQATSVTQTFRINCPAPLPACAAAPTAPANGAALCPQSITLSWPAVSGATSYDVYFGTAGSPPFVANVAGTSYSVGTLSSGTYFWQILPKNANGTASGCAVWSFSIDIVPPTISNCPNNQFVLRNASCIASLPDYTAVPNTGDNCSAVTVTQTPAPGLSLSGTVTVVLTATDGSGNTATCSFTATPLDQMAPTITCPTNLTLPNAPGQCGANPFFANATGSDNCGAPTITQIGGPASGSFFAVGTTSVTFRATDGTGNSTTCSFAITVNDTEPPVMSNCPGNQTASVNASCQGTMADYIGSGASASDNCFGTISPGAFQQSPAPGATFTGTTVVTLSATDQYNNTGTCTFLVTVVDNTPPTITCNVGTLNPAANAACQYVVPNLTGFATANDNCGTPTLSQTPTVGTTLGLGSSTLVLRATDGNGNSSTCSITLSVTDQTPPTISNCPNNQFVLRNASCIATLPNYAPVATTSDNCSAVTVTQAPAAGTTLSGTVTVVLTATDASGNTNTCSFTATPVDQTPPTITCPTNITQPNTTGQCAANVTFANATGSDNCGTPTITQIAGPASGSSFAVGTTTVTFRATDASNNSTTCSFSVTVNDTQAPSISCPVNITQPNTTGQCAANVSFANATGTDNCGTPTITQIAGPASGSSFAVGTTTVTFRATDASNNSVTCSFSVTVNDTQAPSISCPANITQPNTAGQCAANVSFANATATDNCPGTPTITQIAGPASGSSFAVGTTTVTFRATDGANNSATCSFAVTVNDTQASSITCPANLTQPNTTGQCGANVSFANATATDNCPGTPTITQIGGPASGSFFAVGTTTVTFRATDGANNSATCSFSVTVNDTQAPSISCPANITQNSTAGQCGANVTYSTPVGTDNCSATTTQIGGLASGAFFAAGTTVNTFRATDPAGNSTTCSFSVTINDGQAPSITCPANISQPNTAGQCGANVTYTAPVGTDNCSATTTQIGGLASGAFFPVGTTTNVFRAMDASGNSTTCAFSVTINDTQAPSITCPANQSQSNTTGQCGANLTYTTPVGTDNCSATTTQIGGLASGAFFPVGTTTNVFRATDPSGNSTTCAFSVTINDTQAPTIACPANIAANTAPNLCGANVSFVTPVGADNCSAATTQIGGLASGAFFPVGTTTNVFRATDPSGNTAQCSFTITVSDVQPPSITCPVDKTVGTTGYTCQALASTVALGLASASDNCTINNSPGNNAPAAYSVGATSVIWTVTDASGNSATCVQTVTVLDLQLPVVQCPGTLTAIADPSSCTAVVDYAAAAYDNCSGVALTYNHPPLSEFELNATSVTVTATDASGNANSCSFLVYVNRAEEVCNDIDDDCDGIVDESDDWQFVGRRLASDGQAGEQYGTAVDLSGSYAVVGAQNKTPGGQTIGAAYLLHRDANGNWLQLMKLEPTGLEAGDRLGEAVAIDGGWLAVGAPGDDDVADNTGAIYLYRQDAGSPDLWTEFAKLTLPGASANDLLGAGLSLDGDYLLAGALGDDEASEDAGAVYVFSRNNGGTNNWGLLKQLTPPFAASNDGFGAKIDFDGAHAIISAAGDDQYGDNAGAAYLFGRNTGGVDNFGLVTKLLAGDGDGADNFGSDVAISGDYALVGAEQQDDKGANAGKVYSFYRNQWGQQNSWGQHQGILDASGQAGDNFGAGVAMQGEYAALTAPGADFPGNRQNAGKVLIYQLQQGGWVPVDVLTDPTGNNNDYFGSEVAMDGRTTLVGTGYDDQGIQLDRGAVTFFEGVCAEGDSRDEHRQTSAGTLRIQAFPVPFSDRLTIRVEGATTVRIVVLNNLGQEVALVHDGAVREEGAQFEWNAGRFQAGLYFVRVQTSLGVETKPVTLAR